MTRFWTLLFLVAALYPGTGAAAPGGTPTPGGVATPGAKTTFSEVASELMSPVCPGKLLHDCPSSEGAQLRELVRRKIFAGETKEQIIGYFVEVYGRDVLPKPPAEGFYLTAWLLPMGGLLAGFGVVVVLVRAWKKPREDLEEAAAGGGEVPQGGASPDGPIEDRLRRELKEFEG